MSATGLLNWPQIQHSLIPGQKQRETLAVRQELHPRVRLAMVSFEPQWQLTIALQHLPLCCAAFTCPKRKAVLVGNASLGGAPGVGLCGCGGNLFSADRNRAQREPEQNKYRQRQTGLRDLL